MAVQALVIGGKRQIDDINAPAQRLVREQYVLVQPFRLEGLAIDVGEWLYGFSLVVQGQVGFSVGQQERESQSSRDRLGEVAGNIKGKLVGDGADAAGPCDGKTACHTLLLTFQGQKGEKGNDSQSQCPKNIFFDLWEGYVVNHVTEFSAKLSRIRQICKQYPRFFVFLLISRKSSATQ